MIVAHFFDHPVYIQAFREDTFAAIGEITDDDYAITASRWTRINNGVKNWRVM